MKKWRLFDTIIIICGLFLLFGLAYKGLEAKAYSEILKPIKVEIVVPNLDPEVAKQIKIGDSLVDKNAKPVFVIVEKAEKQSQHPAIDKDGNIVVSEHPLLVSLYLWVESTEPVDYENGIRYNWQVIKVGGSLIWETTTERFVGLVRQLIVDIQ
ncbi:MAG: DUF4330 family protein [Caldisericia bacterium]|nr:DUF4330 family protein [Caldisericia bacterium]